MLKIRPEQMEILDQAAYEALIERQMPRIREKYPNAEAVPESRLRSTLRSVLKRGYLLGLRNNANLSRCLHIAAATGPRFFDQPEIATYLSIGPETLDIRFPTFAESISENAWEEAARTGTEDWTVLAKSD